MVSLRGAASARVLSVGGLLLRLVVLVAIACVAVMAFLSGIDRTAALVHRLSWIETVGLFGLRAGFPLLVALGCGYGAWESLTTLFGRGDLREAVRIIVTEEGVWSSAEGETYPESRRLWSKLDGVLAEPRGRLLRIRAMRPLKPKELLWQRFDSAEAASDEANRLNAIFAALQAAAPPKKDDEDATESEESTPSSRDR
jgi:hypothetical protein